jgi:hypothetical protein
MVEAIEFTEQYQELVTEFLDDENDYITLPDFNFDQDQWKQIVEKGSYYDYLDDGRLYQKYSLKEMQIIFMEFSSIDKNLHIINGMFKYVASNGEYATDSFKKWWNSLQAESFENTPREEIMEELNEYWEQVYLALRHNQIMLMIDERKIKIDYSQLY